MVVFLRRIRQVVRLLHTAWSIAGITLIAILLTEGGFRLIFAIKDHFAGASAPDPRVIVEGYGGESWLIDHYRELERLADRWEPYTYFRQKPFSGRTITVDQHGRRLTWQPPQAPAGRPDARVVKVLMLGGSSLWGYGARDDRTIPSLLARSLYERGHRIEVKNLAEIGYVSTQEVVALARELQSGYRPDLVVFYDGVNDVTSALLEGEAGVTTNERNRRAEFNLRQSPGRLANAMVARLIEDSSSYRFARVLSRRLSSSPASDIALPQPDRQGELLADVLRKYRANLAIVDELARGYGFHALYFWQPVVFEKKTLTASEREEASKVEWGRRFFVDVYAAIRGSQDLRSVDRFHDLGGLFADASELVFIDYCHTTEAANERIAHAISRYIEDRLRQDSPAPHLPGAGVVP